MRKTKEIKINSMNEVRVVDRLKEISLFENQLLQLRSGHDAAKPIIDFWGIPGIGKSTLLREIFKKSISGNNKTVFIDLKEIFLSGKRLSNSEVCKFIISKLHSGMFNESLNDDLEFLTIHSAKEAVDRITTNFLVEMQNYLSRDKKHLVVFLIDSVEYCKPEVFKWLEKVVFSPLVSTKKVMIVLSSQSRKSWDMFDVRQRTIEYKIKPFDSNLLWKQIGYDDGVTKELVTKIFDITFGVPACNRLVYNSLERLNKKKDLLAEFNDLTRARLIHDEVEYFFGETVKKLSSELKFVLKVISHLKWFDYALLREILISTNPDRYVNMKASKFRDVTRQLEETNYINWDIQNRGFAMDITLRKILSLDLKVNNHAVYLKIQNAVIQWFRRLVKEHDSSFLFFLDLVYYKSLFGDFKTLSSEINDAVHNIEHSQRNHLEKIMTLEQVLRTIDEPESKEIIPVEYSELIRKKSKESLERLLVIDAKIYP